MRPSLLALCLTAGQLGSAGCSASLAGLGQFKTMLFCHVQQRGHRYPAPCLDAAPGAGAGLFVVAVGASAPALEQVPARVVGILAFDGHGNTRPFITRQVCRDVCQGGADQLGGNQGWAIHWHRLLLMGKAISTAWGEWMAAFGWQPW